MKVRLSLIVLVLMTLNVLSAQDIYLYFLKGDIETMLRNTELIVSDYMNWENSASVPGLSQQKEETKGKEGERIGSFDAPVETIITPSNSHLKLPLSYKWNNLKFGTSIPYYLKREMSYDKEVKSASGLGDISLSSSYNYLSEDIVNIFVLNLKLPTGKADNEVDGFLVPLGTGSTDVILNNKLIYIKPNYSIYSNVSFRFNTPHKMVMEVEHESTELGKDTIEYELTNGHLFILKSSFIYRLINDLGAVAGFSIAVNGEGNQDRVIKDHTGKQIAKDTGLSANQDFTFLDFIPALTYTIYRFDVSLGAKVPLMTKKNEQNTEPDRKTQFMFQLSRNMF